ncbi:MAG: hypothetical protein UY70_C0001G0002 [Candidatus Kaiserbacteria bacterium GW2011_GWB1_52_6]|uniref:Uncharacterized protein n=2 Tax=Candidatus Kaiseribacteriota TaxID=1752734 RepID=A0A0G1XB41_9BACT|nr:MAG: hypothetical protein UY67_C0007G0002 [Candidatus Kaiserbacteria bacterium GW2011_GWA2_52_12]KKW28166.1 MAG: hypothetical protein UY70_C0001G0002 [Candidatus Kaiserbacteria bacterium GW2011_GWB1_52_6]
MKKISYCARSRFFRLRCFRPFIDGCFPFASADVSDISVSTEIFISEIGAKADVIIVNDGSREELLEKVEIFYQEHLAAHF